MSKMAPDGRNVIGENVSCCCREKGMTYYALSEKCGVPLTTILHIVDGSTGNPGIYTMERICRGLDIPLAECLNVKK